MRHFACFIEDDPEYKCVGWSADIVSVTPNEGGWAATVIGPDSDKLAAGLRVPSTGWPKMEVEVDFICLASGIQVGGAAAGIVKAEERIRRGINDSGWVGAAGEFYWDTSAMIDKKYFEPVGQQSEDAWNNLPIGATFDNFYQQNRLIIEDCAGVEQIFYFQERQFRKVKVNATSWQLEEVI